MLFSHFATTATAIMQESSTIKKAALLFNFFTECTPEEGRESAAYFSSGAKKGRKRTALIAETLMKKWLSEYFADRDLAPLFTTLGDCGSVFEQLHTLHPQVPSSLLAIFSTLTTLHSLHGAQSQERKKTLLYTTFAQLSPIEGKFFIRCITGTLRIGVCERTIIAALALFFPERTTAALRLTQQYVSGTSVATLAEQIVATKETPSLPTETTVTLHRPFHPQAADRIQEHTIPSSLFPCYVQGKYDGLRLQFHIEKTTITAFSRNLLSATGMFPEIEASLKTFFHTTGGTGTIFDGEIVAWDEERNTPLSFQKTAQRRQKYQKDTQPPVRYILFDILMDNGNILCADPYEERIARITTQYQHISPSIIPIATHLVTTREALCHWYATYCAEGFEGIMIKSITAPYEPGKRTKTWLKWKSLQKTSLGDTFDCVVIGYYYGKGKRAAQGIGSLLVALYDQEQYIPFVKVGTGGNETLWKTIEQECQSLRTFQKPESVLQRGGREPDVWCLPQLVVSITGDTLTRSNEYESAFSLRFPRLIALIKDKDASQATTITEMLALQKEIK